MEEPNPSENFDFTPFPFNLLWPCWTWQVWDLRKYRERERGRESVTVGIPSPDLYTEPVRKPWLPGVCRV